jgi:hypothetical protein
MTANGMRRLEIIVPEDHPIFAQHPGSRARVAREWLDLGARLSAIEHELRGVKKRLSDMENIHPIGQGGYLKQKQESANSAGNAVKIDDFI